MLHRCTLEGNGIPLHGPEYPCDAPGPAPPPPPPPPARDVHRPAQYVDFVCIGLLSCTKHYPTGILSSWEDPGWVPHPPPLTRGCSTARQCSSRGSVGSKLSPTFTLTYTIPTCDTHYTHIGWPPMRVPHTARLRRLCCWQELGALLRRKDGTSTARASTASTSRPSSRRTVVPDTLRRQNRHYEERSLEGFQHIDD